jgi:hypothetical protein
MVTQKDIKAAKEAYDTAWNEAAKYAAEALDALNKASLLNVSDENNIFAQRAKRATEAYENWCKAAENCAKVLRQMHETITRMTDSARE